jgi:hypothetical protein
MTNIVVTPEVDIHNNVSDEVPKQSLLWEDYANKLNAFTDLIITAGIDPELLADVVRATISLYRGKK